MSYLTKPTSDGTYRIKVLDNNLYIESVPGNNAGLKLASLDSSNNKQKWKLARVSGTTATWTIVSVEDQSGLSHYKTQQTYWGYGYPLPQKGASEKWDIKQRTSEGKTFSKITLSGNSNPFDSCDPGSDAVHFYYDHNTVSSAPKQCYVFELVPDDKPNALDIIFLQDSTGSQQPYIDKARAEIADICNTLASNGNFASGDLRVGLVAFRDHSPQDKSFITTVYPLTSDISSIETSLAALVATGGGDGPEAQSDALADALYAGWREDASKVAVLITDAPPHGLGEDGDGFPKGCPAQNEPIHIAKKMAKKGITLYVIACEPTLSGYYKKAHDFYVALVELTGGRFVPLGEPFAIKDFIIGSASEAIALELHVVQHQADLIKQAATTTADAIAANLHDKLSAAGVHVDSFVVEDYYVDSEQGRKNVAIWSKADKLADAKDLIKDVDGHRIVEAYRSGGQPSVTLKKQAITLDHAKAIVHKSLARNS